MKLSARNKLNTITLAPASITTKLGDKNMLNERFISINAIPSRHHGALRPVASKIQGQNQSLNQQSTSKRRRCISENSSIHKKLHSNSHFASNINSANQDSGPIAHHRQPNPHLSFQKTNTATTLTIYHRKNNSVDYTNSCLHSEHDVFIDAVANRPLANLLGFNDVSAAHSLSDLNAESPNWSVTSGKSISYALHPNQILKNRLSNQNSLNNSNSHSRQNSNLVPGNSFSEYLRSGLSEQIL